VPEPTTMPTTSVANTAGFERCIAILLSR